MIAIIDYGTGNLASVYKALLYIGQDAHVTSDPREALKADAVILPGVGAMSNAMMNLRNAGFVDALYEIVQMQKPLMGICLGMQMLFETSEEGSTGPDDLVKGLGILKGSVVKLPEYPLLKIPHMGWNQIFDTKGNLFKEGESVYFVHSYYACPEDSSIITARTRHGIDFTSSVEKGSVCAMQFHPEKSGDVGLDILRAWVRSY